MAIGNAIENALAGKAADAIVILGTVAVIAGAAYLLWEWWSKQSAQQQQYDLVTSNPITEAGASIANRITALSTSPAYANAVVDYTQQPMTLAQLQQASTQNGGSAVLNVTPQGMGGYNPAYGNTAVSQAPGSFANPYTYTSGWQGPGVYMYYAAPGVPVIATFTNYLDYANKKAD